MSKRYIPMTPAGSILMHLEADTEDQAWENLMEEASHMPYETREDFIKRGYEIGTITGEEEE